MAERLENICAFPVLYRNLHKKGIFVFFAFCPDFSFMLLNNAFRNGKAKSVTFTVGSCFVNPVKSLENIFEVLFRDMLPFAFHRKNAVFFLFNKFDPNRRIIERIFIGIIQKDPDRLLQVIRASVKINILIDPVIKILSAFKINRLERKNLFINKVAEIKFFKNHFRSSVICPCKVKKIFDKTPHAF